MRNYIFIDKLARTSCIVSFEEATSIAGIDPADVEWALENEGLFEANGFVIAEYMEPVNAKI